MKIKVTVDDKPTRTFASTDEVRSYLNGADDFNSDTPPATEASVPMIPTVTVPQPGEYTLEEREEEQTASEPEPEPETPPAPQKKGSRRVRTKKALEILDRIRANLAPGEQVTSSRFRRALIVDTDCTDTAAHTWVWKLNQKPYNAGIVKDGVRL